MPTEVETTLQPEASAELEQANFVSSTADTLRESIDDGFAPQVARTNDEARLLLEHWESFSRSRSDAPSSLHAHSSFYLPFLASNSSCRSPLVVLWESATGPRGVLIARIAMTRAKCSLGPVSVPMPLLKTLEIVHGGFVADSPEVAQQQLQYLRDLLASKEIDCVAVHHLTCDSALGEALSQGLQKQGEGNPVHTEHWYTELTDSEGEPVITNSSKTRGSFRRKDRKLERHFDNKIHIDEITEPDQITSLIKAASKIGDQSYQGGLGVGVRDSPHWQSILRILAENGQLRGFLLQADGKNIAYAVGGLCNGCFCYMAASFLPEHREIAPGGYLLRRILEKLQAEGVRWFDFGFGDASYKALYGNKNDQEVTLHFYGSSIAAQATRLADGATRLGKRWMRALLVKSGLMTWTKRQWRRRLEHRTKKPV
ncbi:GNAT family N-acetyltransferase [Microbulbifer agarilyticus]